MPLPKLRNVDAFPVEGFSTQGIGVPVHVFHLMTQLDGNRTPRDLQSFFSEHYNGTTITEDQIGELVSTLDDAYLLDSDRYRLHRLEVEAAYRRASVRPAAHAGASYPEQPDELRLLMDGFFEADGGPGRPTPGRGGAVRGLIAPHIDFGRGGPCFAWAYHALAEGPPPDVFVVFGTGHSAGRPYSTSLKAYETPLGAIESDQAIVTRLLDRDGQDVLADEFAQKNEHSIEFQAVFLRYLYPDRDITFVPVLCGSFHELVSHGASPSSSEAVEDFVAALGCALEGEDRRICFIAGVDFSHVGQRFGDEGPLEDAFIDRVAHADRTLIDAAVARDPERFFRRVVQDGDCYRVCGTSSIYTMLRVMDAEEGTLLKYDRAVDRKAQSLVSFASVVFR